MQLSLDFSHATAAAPPVRLPGPTDVVPVLESDDADWLRFPRGLPHLVSIKGTDGPLYSCRVRTHNGRLALTCEPSADLAVVRQWIRNFRSWFCDAMTEWRGFDEDLEAQIALGVSLEHAHGFDIRAAIESGGFDPFAIVAIEEFDGNDLERFPHAWPFPLALGPGKDGNERYAVAVNWLGELQGYRLKDYDSADYARRIAEMDFSPDFMMEFDDPVACKAQVLADLAEGIFIWGRHLPLVAPYLPDVEAWSDVPADRLCSVRLGGQA